MQRYLLLPLICFLFFSCTVNRKIPYFQNLQDNEVLANVPVQVHTIQNGDILSITVSSLNQDAANIFNQPLSSELKVASPTGTTTQSAGYLVDQAGYIRFPIIGNVQAAALTKEQFADNLRSTLINQKLLVDPIIDIRVLNYKVTVLGEVVRPTVITVPNERITILEALGLAGDLTIFAKRENVLVVREIEGKRVAKRIDLNSNELFSSPYYYLKTNDVVYVEPNKARRASSSRFNLYLPAIINGLTATVIIIDRLTR